MFETFSKKTFAMWNYSNIFIHAEEPAKTNSCDLTKRNKHVSIGIRPERRMAIRPERRRV